jgi:3-oxoacyl-[acyl-carrier-protein] synthase-3
MGVIVAERKSVRYAHVAGWGKYVPTKVITNEDLARSVETSDEWIVSRTGIRERRIAASPKETTATMSFEAAKQALEVAGITPNDLGLIIIATVTPVQLPATACVVQDMLGAEHAGRSTFRRVAPVHVRAGDGGASDCQRRHSSTCWHWRETLSRIVVATARRACYLAMARAQLSCKAATSQAACFRRSSARMALAASC